jgi:hypothetical protein
MNERIASVIQNKAFIPVVTGVSSFAVGVGMGYFLGRRKVDVEEMPAIDEDEIKKKIDAAFENMKNSFDEPVVIPEHVIEGEVTVEEDDIHVPPRVVIPAERIEKVDDFLQEVLTSKDDVPEEPAVIAKNVFAGNDETWNYEEEKAKRTTTEPYLLHKDEFYAEENADKGYSQVTLTYYAGDDILVDEDQSPIYNHGGIIGELKFGHGSGDPNVFYVRNDVRNAEYEIVFDEGSYSEEVLGIQIENNERQKDLKHSHSPRRFRPE